MLCLFALAPLGGAAVGISINGVHKEQPGKEFRVIEPEALQCLGGQALKIEVHPGKEPLIIPVESCAELDSGP